MKRFLVFAGDYYYPSGGWEDFVGSFDTLEAAKADAARRTANEGITGAIGWAQVVDSVSGEMVSL